MRKSKSFYSFALGLTMVLFIATSLLPAQQTDPFYKNLLENAQKSFLARNYEEAARDLEIAAFGLLEDKTLRAKAYVYLSLCKYYLKDIGSSEKSLREAAALMSEEGFEKLAIYESAWPDVEKLMTFFNIVRAQVQPIPREVAKPAPPALKPPISKQSEPQAKPDEKPGGTPAQQGPQPTQSSGTSPDSKELDDPPKTDLRIDAVKEGDLLSIDLVDIAPTAIKRVPAAYPSYTGASAIEGTVLVNALISEKGEVIKTQLIKGLKDAFGFDQAALRAVRQWKFEPASIKGIKVKVWIPIAIEFKKGQAL